VQFRNVDGAGNSSAWTPAPSTAAGTVRLDRSAPTAPTVSGGSLTCSHSIRTITGSGASDGSGSGVSRYEYRVSSDGGASYGAGTSGSSIQFATTGSYVVQFRAVDMVGLASAWAPATPGASNSACIT
jgi:large repetitive protein